MAGARAKRRRVNSGEKKIDAATVLGAMRRGECLILEHRWYGRCWCLSGGTHIDDDVAKIVVKNQHVAGVGDSLFKDTPSQTWRWSD
jgi:hypothetical protein